MDLRLRIQQLMEERGWSEYRLSKESGLSQSTVANMLRKNNAPTLPTLEAACKAFSITLPQFFSEGGEPVKLNEEQKELFKQWSTLSDVQRSILLEILKTM